MEDQNTSPTPPVPEIETAEQKYARLYETPKPPEVAVAAPTPDPVNLELLETVRALKTEIGNLRQVSAPRAEAATPTQWFDYLRAGEWDKAEADLIDRVRSKVLSEAESAASTKAFEAMTVQLEVDRYLNDLRSKNPDIIPMEEYLHAPVQVRIERLKKEGKISSNADFIREYKGVVEDEVSKLRKITGQYRAAGTQEARTRQQEVAQSTPLQPQGVSSLQEGSSPTPSPDVSLENYFARRKGVEAIRKGMGPTNLG